jgi:GNAT superfamily N-acetyltransferase
VNERDLVLAANANYIASFEKLAEHSSAGAVREVGGVFAFVSGHPVPLFNGCVVTKASTAAQLGEALHWVRDRKVPYRVWIAATLERELGSVARQAGLERTPVPYPNMVLHPVPKPPRSAPSVVVAPAARDDFIDVSVNLGLRRELAEAIFSPGFDDDPDVRLFTGRLYNEPAGYSVAIRSGNVSGVYNVGVAPAARRRGVGTALTWAAVDAGRTWGCETVVLQSTEMAFSMYEAMGFRTVVDYAVFREPVNPIGEETPVPPSPAP